MDRGVSPSPPSAHSSQDLGRPRRSVASYRLFPIVEPTPPASPVTLQRNTLSRASGGSSRRRSSSLDHGARLSLLTSGQSTLPATTFSGGRKGSLPELRPLRAARERDQHASRPPSRRALKSAADVRAPADENAHNRSNSAPGKSSESNGKIMADDVVQDRVNQHAAHASPGRQRPSVMPHDINQTQTEGHRHRAKPKPNLRIAITKNEQGESRPPPPPPKSPRHRKEEHGQVASPKRDSHSPISPTTVRSYLDPPQTPHHFAAVAQQLPVLPLSGEVRVRELTVSSVASRGRTPSEQSPTMRPRNLEESKPALIQVPASKFSAFPTISSRPKTSNGPVPSSSTRTSSLPPKRSLVNLKANNLSSANISRPLKSPAFIPSVFANGTTATSREGSIHDAVPSTPRQANRPPIVDVQQSPAASVSESIADVIRKHTGNQDRNHAAAGEAGSSSDADPTPRRSPNAALAAVAAARARVAALQNAEPTTGSFTDTTASESPMKRPKNASLAAVAAARANVAALQDFESPLTSPRIVTSSLSPGSDSGSAPRSLMTEVLSRRPSIPGQTDPVDTLKGISEQCEALHARYASLRAERQKVSSGIIANLKDQKPGPEYCNMLLDEQLSLAAVSSSMDICIAKLKSLECRREDAIAALIAQTTQTKTSPADHIAAMIASMAISRKPSLAPSMDSGSRFIQTGRSTPDVSVDGLSANRSTCSSFPRTVSYTSESDSHDYRLSGYSRKPSLGSELTHHTALAEDHTSENSLRIGESPKANRRTPLHEPSEALEELKEEADSTIQESQGVVSPLLRGTSLDEVSKHEDISRPSTSDTSTSDELLDQPKRIRVDGAKAAKILGLLSHDGPRSPLINPSHEVANASQEQQRNTEVEIELYPSTYKPRSPAANAPYTIPSMDFDAPLESPFSRTDDLDSPSLQDLDVQLGNFPKPAPSVPPKDIPKFPPPPPPPPKYSTTHSEQQQMRKRRHDSPVDLQHNCSVKSSSTTATNKRPLSQKSAHTIQVYLDQDQDDLLELYKLRSAATTTAVS